MTTVDREAGNLFQALGMFSVLGLFAPTNTAGIIISPCLANDFSSV